MELNQYQDKAAETKVYSEAWNIIYPAMKLSGEAGEVAEYIGKHLRRLPSRVHNLKLTDEQRDELIKELGDVLWYIAAIATDINCTLDHVAQTNIAKLGARQEQGTLDALQGERT